MYNIYLSCNQFNCIQTLISHSTPWLFCFVWNHYMEHFPALFSKQAGWPRKPLIWPYICLKSVLLWKYIEVKLILLVMISFYYLSSQTVSVIVNTHYSVHTVHCFLVMSYISCIHQRYASFIIKQTNSPCLVGIFASKGKVTHWSHYHTPHLHEP